MSSYKYKYYTFDMIICKLDDLLWEHRTTAKEVSKKTGISENTLSLLRNNNTTRYDSKTLDMLCSYFNCKVSDLLEYEP